MGIFRQWEFFAMGIFRHGNFSPKCLLNLLNLDVPHLWNGKRICGERSCLKILSTRHEPRHFKEEHTGTNPYFLTVNEYERMSSKSKDKIKKQMKEA